MRPLVAHCHFGLEALYRRTGSHARAHEHLAIGAAMYRGMGMTFWLNAVAAEERAGADAASRRLALGSPPG